MEKTGIKVAKVKWDEMVLEERLGNDPETERRVLRVELAKINRIRLIRVLGPEE